MTVTELCNENMLFSQLFVHRTMLDSTIYVELLREKKKNMLPVNVGFFVVLV